MKLGIFSDIHADARSLDKALTLLHKQGVDALICAGDLVDGMSEGNAAAQRVKELNIPVVMGNHDLAFSRPRNDKNLYRISLSSSYDPDALTDDTIHYLASLPHTRELTYDGVKIVLAHANTWDFATYVFPSASSLPKIQKMKTMIPEDARAVILGHTHVPMHMTYHELHIFNPGSVEGNRYSATRSCAVLTLPSFEYEVFDINRGTPIAFETFNFFPQQG